MNFLRRILLALSTGYILFFYSERVFWSLVRPGDTPIDYLLTPIFYALLAYIFLIVVDEFRVRNIWAVFIAGAAFGWIGEGVVAMTLFGGEIPFPFSISWTGLAWHALLSVLIGWYYLRKILEENNDRKTAFFSLAVGAFWGFWSIAWGLETPPIVAPIPEYLIHGLAVTFFLIISQWLFTQADPKTFHAGKIEKIFFAVITLLFFGAVTVSFIGVMSLVILPPLFLLLYIILRKNKSTERGGSILTEFGSPVRWRNMFLLFIMPITATVIYTAANALGLIFRTNLLFLVVTTALGFIMFGMSWVKIFRN